MFGAFSPSAVHDCTPFRLCELSAGMKGQASSSFKYAAQAFGINSV
eukprot:gene17883-13260_t